MGTEKTSLRSLVEKWLAPSAERPLRIARTGRTASGARYVALEVLRLAGPVTIAFFRHGNGAWCVFPPTAGLRLISRA